MKPIRLLRIAQIELDEAIAYYESQLLGLGNGFLEERKRHPVESQQLCLFPPAFCGIQVLIFF